MTQYIVKIALDVPLNRLFDYASGGLPVQIGQRVLVSFGHRQQIGVVMALADTSDVPAEKLKPITEVFDDALPISAEVLQLIQFSADYYQTPLGQALLAALPARLRQIAPAQARKQYVYQLSALGLAQNAADLPKRQLVLQRIFAAFAENNMLTDAMLDAISATARKTIKQLITQGWVESIEVLKQPKSNANTAIKMPTLNGEQADAVEKITAGLQQFNAWLLHGITGSGKTEVYMQVMQAVLNESIASQTNVNETNSPQILVLVPEINLTPQLEGRFRSRFPQHTLVSLHSNLSESERLHHWQLAQSGAADIVIGTRLSIFTPMPHLKLIIIDEEHDGSYKQQDSMRYHARDVAIMRAKQRNIPVLLGSATPALESWYNAKPQADAKLKGTAKYQLLSLKTRAVTAAQLPHISCVDTTKVNLQQGLTPQLLDALKLRLERKEQSLLFINRRGYSPVLLCSACHWIAPCTRCSSRLVVHLGQRRLRCHHCGHDESIVKQCPSCGNADLHPTGHGTQRLEQTLAQLFPAARIARVDRDSTSRKDALVHILNSVHAGEIDILIGTQMLAKGHDFPNLTLVGVVDTDSALHSPDFRASERLFAQLMQVAGRAGRADKAGQVLIQTQFPDHALFNALRSQDYAHFADAQLQEREMVRFPPYVFTALVRAEANDYAFVAQFLNMAFELSVSAHASVTVYAPVRPQMERLKGMERGYLLLQSNKRNVLQGVLKATVAALRAQPLAQKVRWAVDVDPLEF